MPEQEWPAAEAVDVLLFPSHADAGSEATSASRATAGTTSFRFIFPPGADDTARRCGHGIDRGTNGRAPSWTTNRGLTSEGPRATSGPARACGAREGPGAVTGSGLGPTAKAPDTAYFVSAKRWRSVPPGVHMRRK